MGICFAGTRVYSTVCAAQVGSRVQITPFWGGCRAGGAPVLPHSSRSSVAAPPAPSYRVSPRSVPPSLLLRLAAPWAGGGIRGGLTLGPNGTRRSPRAPQAVSAAPRAPVLTQPSSPWSSAGGCGRSTAQEAGAGPQGAAIAAGTASPSLRSPLGHSTHGARGSAAPQPGRAPQAHCLPPHGERPASVRSCTRALGAAVRVCTAQ